MRQTRPRFRMMLLGIIAMVTMVGPGTAQAHWVEERREGWFVQDPELCVYGQVTQEHRYHNVTTSAYNRGCSYANNTWFTQYQQYFKTQTWGAPGDYCGYQGWNQSRDGDHAFYANYYQWDIWSYFPCNYGLNVNVWISIDSWQYAWTDSRGYLGSAWRPMTKHCHCP